jgi:flagellar biosynthesis protein FlhG
MHLSSRMPGLTAGDEGTHRKNPEIIAVTSGKGGVGKSSISVNMAILLQQMQKKVLLIDADLHLGSVDLILGIRSPYTIADVVRGKVPLLDVIQKTHGGIDVLPASSAITELLDMEDVILQKLANAFSGYEGDYDVIIVDTGAGISQNVMSFVLGSDKVVLVATPDPASMADAYATIKVIRHNSPDKPIFMMANMVNLGSEGESLYKKMNLMVRKFLGNGIEYGGSIVKDDMVARSIRAQRPFVLDNPGSSAANALRILGRKLLMMPRIEEKVHANFFKRFLVNRKIRIEGIV